MGLQNVIVVTAKDRYRHFFVVMFAGDPAKVQIRRKIHLADLDDYISHLDTLRRLDSRTGKANLFHQPSEPQLILEQDPHPALVRDGIDRNSRHTHPRDHRMNMIQLRLVADVIIRRNHHLQIERRVDQARSARLIFTSSG